MTKREYPTDDDRCSAKDKSTGISLAINALLALVPAVTVEIVSEVVRISKSQALVYLQKCVSVGSVEQHGDRFITTEDFMRLRESLGLIERRKREGVQTCSIQTSR